MTPKSDDSGQWLLLMAVIAAVGMAILLVFINQSVMAGYASSGSVMDFPKNDIRELRSEVISETYVLAVAANKDGTDFTDRKARFRNDFGQFKGDLQQMYALRGVNVEVEDNLDNPQYLIADKLENIPLHIDYINKDTSYSEDLVILI